MTLNLYEQADALDEAMATIDQWITEHPAELEASGGALPKEITAEYDKLMKDQKDSIVWHAKKLQEYDAEAEMIEKERARLAIRQAALERKRAWRERMLFDYMQREGMELVKHPLVTVKIKLNPPKVVAPLWSQLELGQLWASPDYEWCVVRKDPEFRLDLNAIKAAERTKEGFEEAARRKIPEGVTLVQDKSLSIR